MIGEISAVATALLWSVTNIMIRSASNRIGVLSLNAIRMTAGAIFVLGTLVVVGKPGDLGAVPLRAAAYMIAGVIGGSVVGDTLYFRSMAAVGVSRASPISNIYPLFTLPIAVIFLGERLHWLNAAGVVLIVIGVSLVARSAAPQEGAASRVERFRFEGILLALAAAMCWAFSTSIQRLALLDLDVFVANAIRVPVAASILLFLASRNGDMLKVRSYGWRPVLLTVLAGVISLGVGGFFYLLAIQTAGAAKTAALSSIAPIFAAPLSAIFLKERVTPLLGVGIILSVAGVWLIV
ncbi:MAG: DMT family transporter [Dehalococcoidia bacterium]|nr:DMT family transporter [Dehalococcoidia bacterium]